MSPVKNVVLSNLEELFLDPPSPRNSVRTEDDHIVRIDADLCEASSVLQKQSLEGKKFFEIWAFRSSVEEMLEAHRNDIFPKNLAGLLDLLSVIDQLNLEELTGRCFDRLVSEVENFTEIDFPTECHPRVILTFFKILVRSPPRTIAPYKAQLSRIAENPWAYRKLISKAVDIIKLRLEQCEELQLECLPVDFNEYRVPVAIVKRNDKFQTLIFHAFQWKPVELFGKYCNLQNLEVGNFFYLKYGSYLLFKSGSSVFLKCLRSDSGPKEVLDSCYILLTRGRFVFAVVRSKDIYSVLKWTNDAHFEQIYSTPSMILYMNFDCISRLLAIQEDATGFSVRQLGRRAAILKDSRLDPIVDILFLRGKMLVRHECNREVTFKVSSGHLDRVSSRYTESGFRRRIDIEDFEFEFAERELVLRKFACSVEEAPFVTLSGDEVPVLSELWMFV